MDSVDGPDATDRAFRRAGWVMLAAFAAAWTIFGLTSRAPGYVHHDTTEIVMWSQLGWLGGFAKHPPLLPWLLRSISGVVAIDWIGLVALGVASMTLGAFAVWRIARDVAGEARALLALGLYMLSPYVTAMAVKLNHNSVLVALWPLVAWALLASLRRPDVRSGSLLGLAAAAAVLAKYYSLLLLAACFIAAVTSPCRGRYWRSPAPYVAAAIFAVLLAPHAHWMAMNEMQPVQHALRASEGAWQKALRFAVMAPAIASPMLLGLAAWRWLAHTRPLLADSTGRGAEAGYRELAVLALAPYLLTIVLTIAFRLQGSSTWAMPAFSLVAILLASLAPAPAITGLRPVLGATFAVLTLAAAAGPVTQIAAFRANAEGAVEPRPAIAQDGATLWAAAIGGGPTIVGGNARWANAASLVLVGHPAGWTGYSPLHAPWITADRIDREGVLLLCRDPHDGCASAAQLYRADRVVLACRKTYRRQLLGMVGPPIEADLVLIAGKAAIARQQAFETTCRAVAGRPESPR